MPNYNDSKHLEQSLPAILNQSIAPREIMIIDDASTDDSVQVIQRILQRFPTKAHLVELCELKTNEGVVAAMNRGLKRARADYLYYAAADDQALPGLFEKSLALLSQYPQAALSCSICEWREVETGWNRHMAVGMGSKPVFYSPAELVKLEQAGRLLISPHTAVLRREAIQQAGGFKPALRWHCDWFAMYVAAFRRGICFVPEPLAVFNIYPASFSLEGQRRDAHREVLLHLLDSLLDPQYDDVRPLIAKSGALFLFGKPLFQLIMSQAKYREFRTPAYLRKAAWQTVRMGVKRIVPRFLANWYFHLCGYKVRKR